MRARQAPKTVHAPPRRIMVLHCPELHSPDQHSPDQHSPDQRAARLSEQGIATVTGFCPTVEAVEPGICAFAARGPARYFGGESALASKIIAAVAELGVQSRVGV